MATQYDKMDKTEINRIKTLIDQMQKDGEVFFYEIIVDGLKVVKKTNDPERFSNYQAYVTPNSDYIRIILFNGTSNNSDAFEFRIKAANADEAFEMSLGEVETTKRRSYTEKEREDALNSRKAKDALAEENERLKKELAEVKAERDEREKYIAQIEEGIEKTKSKEYKQKLELGEIISLSFESYLKRNAQLFKGIPILSGLAGLDDTEEKKEEPQGEATFRKKGEPTPEQPVTLTEEQKEFLRFFTDLQKLFTPQEMVQIFSILEAMSRDKTKIQTVLELVR